MNSNTYPTRLAELMARVGINDTDLARLIETTRQQVFKLRTGERQVSPRWAMKFAPHLGVEWPEIIATQGTDGIKQSGAAKTTALPAVRFRAVRLCVWPQADQAAIDLSLPLPRLAAIEEGAEVPPRDVLFRFCAMAGCPLSFIEHGNMDGVRWELVAWLGHTAPELVPGLLGMGRKEGGGSAEGEGENED